MGLALASKRVQPRVPLAALVAATFALDVLWPVFVLAGVEVVRIDPGNTAFTPLDFASYPWSHSLLMAAMWGTAAGLVARRTLRVARAGLVIGALVVSHWVLDLIVHRADLPVWPGGPRVGLDLWNSVPGTLLVEGALFLAGIVIYARTCPARDAIGRWAYWALMLVLAGAWVSGPFSPPPPGATAVAVVGLAFALLVLPWVVWIERHRASPGLRDVSTAGSATLRNKT